MASPKIKLIFFVSAGQSRWALPVLYKILALHGYTDYELNIVDVGEHPGVAESHGVTSTPSLIQNLQLGSLPASGDS